MNGRVYFLLALIITGCTRPSRPSDPTLIASATSSPTSVHQAKFRDFTFDLIYPSTAHFPKPAVVNATLARAAPDIVAVADWEPENPKAQMLPEAIEAEGMKASDLAHFGEGLSPAQQRQLGKPYAALLFHFRVSQGQNLKILPQAERFVHELCSGQGIIGDDEGGHFCSKASWKERMAAWPEVGPRVRFHPDSEGVTTRGMAVFGQPELRVSGSASYTAEYRALLTVLLAQWLAENPDDTLDKFEFDPRRLGSAKMRELWKTNCRAEPRLPVLISIRSRDGMLVVDWDSQAENNCYVQLLGLSSKIFKPEDPDALKRASRKAVHELLTDWKPQYLKGLKPGESLFVKAAFREGQTTEWMWLEVTGWRDRTVTGLLLEDANLILQFKGGQRVSVREADLFDFLLRSETRQSGGTTDEILKAQQER